MPYRHVSMILINACLELGVGEETERRGFKVKQQGLHKIARGEYSLVFQTEGGFSLYCNLKHTIAISVLHPDEGLGEAGQWAHVTFPELEEMIELAKQWVRLGLRMGTLRTWAHLHKKGILPCIFLAKILFSPPRHSLI